VFIGWTVISSIYSFVLAKKDEIIVFYDFTDASMSFASFLIPVIVFYVGVNQFGADSSALGFASLFLFFYMFWKMSRVVKALNPDRQLLSRSMILSAKLLLPLLLVLKFLPNSPKQKNESAVAYELRRRRQSRDDAAWIAILTGVIFIMIKNRSFSPISDWFDHNYQLEEKNQEDEKLIEPN